MNECLNSDDEDEEHHRVPFSRFAYLHNKACADSGTPGDGKKYVPAIPCSFPLLWADKKNCRVIPVVFINSNDNGLIT